MATDAQETVRVVINADATEARVIISEDADCSSVTADSLGALAEQAGVRMSETARNALQEIAGRVQESPQTVDEVFVKAVEPIHGIDASLKWEPQFDPHAEDEQEQCSESPVDHYAGQSFTSVSSGDHVATIESESEGQDGVSVTGEPIPAREAQPCPIQIENEFNVDGAGRVIAQRDGVLYLHHNRLAIKDVLDITGFVDFNTGHIDFDGSVNIREGIRDKFIVKATGDVTVGGLIESATLVVGGNLHCHRGIAARGDQSKLVVRGDAMISFVNNVRGKIDGHATIRNEIMNCELIIGNGLSCDGSVIGGRVIVGGPLQLGTLGSEGNVPTTIRVGTLPLMTSKIRIIRTELTALRRTLTKCDERIKQLEQLGKGATATDRERLTELSCEKSDAENSINDLEIEHDECVQELKRGRKVQVTITRMVYMRACVETDTQTVTFSEDVKGPLTLGWDESGAVTYRIGDGPVRPINEVAQVRMREQVEEQGNTSDQPESPGAAAAA